MLAFLARFPTFKIWNIVTLWHTERGHLGTFVEFENDKLHQSTIQFLSQNTSVKYLHLKQFSYLWCSHPCRNHSNHFSRFIYLADCENLSVLFLISRSISRKTCFMISLSAFFKSLPTSVCYTYMWTNTFFQNMIWFLLANRTRILLKVHTYPIQEK